MTGLFREAPAHWRTLRLRETVTSCSNGIWGSDACGGEDDIVCVRVADFDRLRLRVDLSNPTVRSVPQAYRHGRMLAHDDLLLEKSGGGEHQPAGAVVLYDACTPAVPSNFIARMQVAPGFDPRYLCYLHAALFYLGVNRRSIHQTTGIQNLDSAAYLSEEVRIPALAEQREAAAALDRKSALVDQLVQNKERLLALLREKRQARIDSAMASDTDLQVPRKHSAAPLGAEIPAHWQVTRLKFVRSGAFQYGANEPAVSEDRAAPRYIRITDLNDDGTLRDDTFQSLPEPLAAPYLLQDGDILLARSGATVGKALRYHAEWGRSCFAGYLVRLRPDRRKILPDYLYYYTQSQAFRRQVWVSTVQSTIANVNAERFGNFSIPLAPLEEQPGIVKFLDERTQKLDALGRVVERQLAKLRDYRRALIVSAVTAGCEGRTAVAKSAQEGV
jgi:type I restriction enzyme S subunit